ncbi:MAG: cation:proton antiporter [Planctomycetota bacterium]|jgi:Kef-type K+ transport system membrane component KefB|nr:cation:proton antiporter [Planctomycetota bacterium]
MTSFLFIFLLIIAVISVASYYLRRVHVPGVVTAMLIGIVVSKYSIFLPSNFDLIDHLNRLIGGNYPTIRIYSVLDALGQLGLIFLMALAGMDVSLRLLRAAKRAVITLSVFTFALPAAMGYCVYSLFYPDDTLGKWVAASLFASHSIDLVLPVIRELKIAATRFGVAVLTATIVTDVSSLVLFAVCVQLQRRNLLEDFSANVGGISLFDHFNTAPLGNGFIPLFVALVLLFIVLALWLVPKVAKHITEQVSAADDLRLTFFLVVVLAVVFIGEVVGVSPIVGAFIAGMAIVQAPGFHDHGRMIFKKMEGIGYGLIIPITFFNIGLQTDLRILGTAWSNVNIVLAVVGGLVASKILSGYLAMWLSGFSKRKALCAGLMTVPQLSATIAAAEVAKQMQIIPPEFFNAIIVLSIVTTIPTPSAVKWLIVKSKIKFDTADNEVIPLARDLVPDGEAAVKN